jgi:hypothetical protein
VARELTSSITIDAPPAQVWRALVDLQRYPAWNPFILAADGVPAVGSRLTLRMRVAGRTFTVRPRVVTRSDERCLRWFGSFGVRGLFDGEHVHELEVHGGGTRYVQRERVSGLLVPFLGKTLAATEAAFDAMNGALKAHVEARQGTLDATPAVSSEP